MSAPAEHKSENLVDLLAGVESDSDLGGTGGDEQQEEQDSASLRFDEAVGVLEEMIVDDEFTRFQDEYLSAHCHEFDSSDENKLSYTPLFEQYVSRMETFLTSYLSARIDGFDMEWFIEECERRGEEELGADVFEVLTSMSEFEEFKKMMVEVKEQKQGGGSGIQLHVMATSPKAVRKQ